MPNVHFMVESATLAMMAVQVFYDDSYCPRGDLFSRLVEKLRCRAAALSGPERGAPAIASG
jgi:hypothetical protein